MKATPHHLLMMLGSLLFTWGLCETAIWSLSIAPSPTDLELLEDFQIERLEKAPAEAVILLGDSSLGNAVDEQILSDQLNVPCRNLALVGSLGLHGDELLLDKIIRSEKKPGALVIMHAASVWNQNAKAIGTESLKQGLDGS